MALEQRRRKMVDYGGPLLPEELKQQSEIASENIRYKAKKIDDLGKAMTNGISIYDNYARRRAYEEAQKRQPPPGGKNFEKTLDVFLDSVAEDKLLSYRNGEQGFIEDLTHHDFNKATGRQYTQEQFDRYKAYVLNTKVFKSNLELAGNIVRNISETTGKYGYDPKTRSIQFEDVSDVFKKRTGKDLGKYYDKKKIKQIQLSVMAKHLIPAVERMVMNREIPSKALAVEAIKKMKDLPAVVREKLYKAANTGRAAKWKRVGELNRLQENKAKVDARKTKNRDLNFPRTALGTATEPQSIRRVAAKGAERFSQGMTPAEAIEEFREVNRGLEPEVARKVERQMSDQMEEELALSILPEDRSAENQRDGSRRRASNFEALRRDMAIALHQGLTNNEKTNWYKSADYLSGARRGLLENFIRERLPRDVGSSGYERGKMGKFVKDADSNYDILKQQDLGLTKKEYMARVVSALTLETEEARRKALKGLWGVKDTSEEEVDTRGGIERAKDFIKGLFGGGKKEESK